MPCNRPFSVGINASNINLFPDELVFILVEHLLVVNGIVVHFPVAGIGKIKSPSMPEGIVRKWIVIFKGYPLGITIDQPNIELVIPSCDIFSQKFQAIVHSVGIQSIVIQPYIPVPVCGLEIRQREIIPTLFYINQYIHGVIVPIGDTHTGIYEKCCIHEVLTASLQPR